jgi:hypothetical protein
MLPTSPTWVGGARGLRGLAPGYNPSGYKSRAPIGDPAALAMLRAKDAATIEDNNRADAEMALKSGMLGGPSNPRNILAQINLNRKPVGLPIPSAPQNNPAQSLNYGTPRGYMPQPRQRAPIHGFDRAATWTPSGFGGLDEYNQLQETDENGFDRTTRAFSDGSMDSGGPSAQQEVERRKRLGLPLARKHGTPKDDGSQRLWERPGQPLLVNDGHAPEFIKMPWGAMLPIEGPQQVITPQVPVQIIPARASGTPLGPPTNWKQQADDYAKEVKRVRAERQVRLAGIQPWFRPIAGGLEYAANKTEDLWHGLTTPDYTQMEKAQHDLWNIEGTEEPVSSLSRDEGVSYPTGTVGIPPLMARPAPMQLPSNSYYGFRGLDNPNDWLKSVAQPAALPRDLALPRAPAPIVEPTTALALGAPVDSREAEVWANKMRAASKGDPALEARAQQATAWAAMTPAARSQVIQREQRQQRFAAAGNAVREQARDPGLWAQLDHFNKTGQLSNEVTSDGKGNRTLHSPYGTGSSSIMTPAMSRQPAVFREGMPGIPSHPSPYNEQSFGIDELRARGASMEQLRNHQLAEYTSPTRLMARNPYLMDLTTLPPSGELIAPAGSYVDPPPGTAWERWKGRARWAPPTASDSVRKDPGYYPVGDPSNLPNRVKSPFPPYTELNVEGLTQGSLALDPKTNQVFIIP